MLWYNFWVIFAISIYCMKFISQEFFPPSQRPELVVELTLPEGSSIKATEEQAEKLAAILSEEQDVIDNFAYYTGHLPGAMNRNIDCL